MSEVKRYELITALQGADWSGTSLGNKALIQTAIIALADVGQTSAGPVIELSRVEQMGAYLEAPESFFSWLDVMRGLAPSSDTTTTGPQADGHELETLESLEEAIDALSNAPDVNALWAQKHKISIRLTNALNDLLDEEAYDEWYEKLLKAERIRQRQLP